jgi:hypothetical protein
MNALIFKPGVTFDSRFLGEDIVILFLEIAYDSREGRFVVNVVAEAGRITDRETDGDTIFI